MQNYTDLSAIAASCPSLKAVPPSIARNNSTDQAQFFNEKCSDVFICITTRMKSTNPYPDAHVKSLNGRKTELGDKLPS